MTNILIYGHLGRTFLELKKAFILMKKNLIYNREILKLEAYIWKEI